jgi:Na+/H+ antiporter NhaC
MNNISKTILLIILLLLIVLIFFALTGLDVRNPEAAATTMIYKMGQLNRAITRLLHELLVSIRVWFQETFTR